MNQTQTDFFSSHHSAIGSSHEPVIYSILFYLVVFHPFHLLCILWLLPPFPVMTSPDRKSGQQRHLLLLFFDFCFCPLLLYDLMYLGMCRL